MYFFSGFLLLFFFFFFIIFFFFSLFFSLSFLFLSSSPSLPLPSPPLFYKINNIRYLFIPPPPPPFFFPTSIHFNTFQPIFTFSLLSPFPHCFSFFISISSPFIPYPDFILFHLLSRSHPLPIPSHPLHTPIPLFTPLHTPLHPPSPPSPPSPPFLPSHPIPSTFTHTPSSLHPLLPSLPFTPFTPLSPSSPFTPFTPPPPPKSETNQKLHFNCTLKKSRLPSSIIALVVEVGMVL